MYDCCGTWHFIAGVAGKSQPASQFNQYLLVLSGWTWPGAPTMAQAIHARNHTDPELAWSLG
jgi:hypothetical protein